MNHPRHTLIDVPIVFFGFEDESRTAVFRIHPTNKEIRVPTCLIDIPPRALNGFPVEGMKVRLKIEATAE